MRKCNPENERIKRAYLEHQKEARKKSQSTVDNIREAITKYEAFTNYEDFKRFNKDKARAFKNHFKEAKSVKTNEPLSSATLLSALRHLKEFFIWLRDRQGYKKIRLYDIDYFNLTEKETRTAQAPKRRSVPTIEQIRKVIFSMPAGNDIELRNRALVAFTLLTGARDSAIASLRLKHIKLAEELVEQIPPEVKTKFSKAIYTYFFPVGDDIKQIVIDWINYLYKTKLYNQDAPLFPRTKLVLAKNNSFKAEGIEPICWSSANPIREVFQEAFLNVGLDYFSPHSFRNTLTQLAERLCLRNPEEFKAWSQNLGHESVTTTFTSYGYVPEYRQGEIIKNLSMKSNNEEKQRAQIIAEGFIDLLKKNKIKLD